MIILNRTLLFPVSLALASLLSISCQQMPTKILAQDSLQGGDRQNLEKFRQSDAVILDVRSPFEFNFAHMPGAINVRWEDFSQVDANSRGLLLADHFSVARRLSLIGIEPSRPVLVVGKGIKGSGEEGRVAWTLSVLGIKNIMTLNHDYFREANPREAAPPVQNKPYWKPAVDDSLFISVKDFKALVLKTNSKVVVLDVRSPAEFLQHNISKELKVPLVNIEWKDFYTDKGNLKPAAADLLLGKGIGKDQMILIISNHGVRSAAVTFVLRQTGFTQSRNFAGGLEQWRVRR